MMVYFIGIDVGTQGARVVVVDQYGETYASGGRKFQLDESFRVEQSPEMWWNDCVDVIDELVTGLPADFDRSSVRAISVTSTSGTVIPLDKRYKPLYNAIMYSDGRSVDQGQRVREMAAQYVQDGYTGFNSSSGISKILWFMETFPQYIDKIHLWVHASDYIVGQLSGCFKVTDYTNVLKSGYDLNRLEWPSYLIEEVAVKAEWLQEVVPSGTVVGTLEKIWSERWGLPQVDVVVGITDGCASQVASGAVNPGDWNTTIGTTMVIKGVSKKKVNDPLGRLYNHRHPEGFWMPGGASNTGADWIAMEYGGDLDVLNGAVEDLIPTGECAWPLRQQGERYPIMYPEAQAIIPPDLSREMLYAANLEGVAFIEKLAYEIIEGLSGEKVCSVYSAGGGSNSDIWMKIRAAVLNVPIYKCKDASGAAGAAINAASQTYYNSLREAVRQMTAKSKTINPDQELVSRYQVQYREFKNKLKQLGYI